MEKNEIQNRLRDVKSLKDFAELLNDIKLDEFHTPKYKISEKQLRHFSIPQIVPTRYKSFQIRKKSGGFREINSPCYQLKVILYILNKVFKAVYTPSKAAMGFTDGRSVVTNAMRHIGHHYVFNIDLENFFPSIPQARVWKRLQLPPFNFPQEIANVVAGLCCHSNADGTMNVLPQGAATSPILTNAICDNLDRQMMRVAREYGVHYSRYADDMTFSCMRNVFTESRGFLQEIQGIIEEQGFKMNEKKTRLQRSNERQEVTGLTVNEKVNVSRKYVKDLRCILHVWEKNGYGKAYAYFYPMYKRDKGYIKKGEPVMENVIEGKLNYLKMVKGADDSTYLKLLERYNKLQTLVFQDNETDKGESYIYVYSYRLKEFEELFETSISLTVSNRKILIGKCVISDKEKPISISKKTQKILCENLAEKAPGAVVGSGNLSKCFVTLCRAKGKNFWLITIDPMQRSKCLSILDVKIDPDHLLAIWEKEGLEEAVAAFHYCISGGDINDFWPMATLLGKKTSAKSTRNKGRVTKTEPGAELLKILEGQDDIDEDLDVLDWDEVDESHFL